jgi:hypothetical protein
MLATDSVNSGKIVQTFFSKFLVLFTVLNFNMSVEFTDKF